MSGHQGFVLGLAFSPEGDRLYSCSIEGELQIWDPLLRTRLDRRPGIHAGPVLALVCPDGTGDLVTGGLDGTVALWSADGALRHRMQGHAGGVHGVAASEDLIASASADARIGLWNRQTGVQLGWLEGHEAAVTSVAFLGPRWLLSGSRDCTVRLWNLDAAQAPDVYRHHDWWVTRVAAVADGQFVSVSEDGALHLWHPHTPAPVWTLETGGPIWALGVQADGRLLATGHDPVLVDLSTRTVRDLPRSTALSSRAMAFSPVDGLLALGLDNGDVELVDGERQQLLGRLEGAGSPVLAGVVGAERLLTCRADGRVTSVGSEGVTRHRGHHAFAYSARGLTAGLAATGGFDGRVCLWQGGDPEPVAEVMHGDGIFSLSMSAEGSELLAAGWDRLTVCALPDLAVLWRLDAAGVGIHLVATFGPDGRVAGTGEAPVLKVWSEAGEVAGHPLPEAHSCAIEAVPGRAQVLLASASGRLWRVNLDSGQSELLHGEHEDWIRVLRISPDGRRALSISQNGSARLFDLEARRVTSRFGRRPVAIGDFDETGSLFWLDCAGVLHSERD